jgi:hypothetical protein
MAKRTDCLRAIIAHELWAYADLVKPKKVIINAKKILFLRREKVNQAGIAPWAAETVLKPF